MSQQAATTFSADAAQPGAAQPVVHVFVVTGSRREAALPCASSILKLQTALIAHTERVAAHLHFVATVDDALNTFLGTPGDGESSAMITNTMIGFEPEFILACMRGTKSCVIGCYPVASIDWARVEARGKALDATEPPSMWGNTYNVNIADEAADHEGFTRVAGVREFGMFYLRKKVLTDIVQRHPEIVAGGRAAFCVPGTFAMGAGVATYMSPEQRFVSLLSGGSHPAYTRLDLPAINTGIAEFAGCVGSRLVLR